MKIEDWLACTDRPFPFYPKFVKVIGLAESIVLCVMMWRLNSFLEELEMTNESIMEESGLTAHQVKAAKAKLTHQGIITVRCDRMAHKSFWMLNDEAVERFLIAVAKVENPPCPTWKTHRRLTKDCTSSLKEEDILSDSDARRKSPLKPESKAQRKSTHKKPAKGVRKPSDSPYAALIALWVTSYQNQFKTPYSFNGGIDGKAVKRLLKLLPPEEMQAVWLHAWMCDCFWCKQAGTISAFVSKINQINQCFKRANTQASLKGQYKEGF